LIEDTGIGIPEEARHRLFESFTQADSSTTRRFGGTGLGLAISKRLVHLMDGEIDFSSEPGAGSKFWFTVPLKIGNQGRLSELQNQLAGKRILVIDDSEVHRLIVRRHLERAGAIVESAATGAEGIVRLDEAAGAEVEFALALLDLHMPAMDGLTLARDIRGRSGYQELPIVIVGSYRDSESAEQAKALRISGFLVKPVRRSYLLETVARALADPGLKEKEAQTPAIGVWAKRVLLVEDNAANQSVAMLILNRLGCETDLAENGREAIAAWTTNLYDLILMDCQMPEMDGFTATREIRMREGAGRRTPIVALTANALEEEKQKCFEAGMDDHLAKPFRKSDLQQVLEKWSTVKIA
jgi:CheY-like chemotaxis protein